MITFGFRNRFSGLARASVAILVGLAMIIWPGDSLNIVVKIIAAAICAAGIISIVTGAANRKVNGMTVPIVNAVVDLLVGILLFIYSGVVIDFVMVLFGILILVSGIFQCVAMFSASSFVRLSFWSFIFPVLCIGGGILVLADPFKTSNVLVIVTGVAVMVYGASELFASWKMYKAQKEYEIRFPNEKKGGSGSTMNYDDIKDAEFEKVDESE